MEIKKMLTQSMEKRCTIKHQPNCISIRQKREGRKVTRDKGEHLKMLTASIYQEDLLILNL